MTKRRKEEKAVKPPLLLPLISESRIEIKYFAGGRKGVLVCNCEEILAYSHEKILFHLNRELVSVTGTNLWCRSFGNRIAEVTGNVESVVFEKSKI